MTRRTRPTAVIALALTACSDAAPPPVALAQPVDRPSGFVPGAVDQAVEPPWEVRATARNATGAPSGPVSFEGILAGEDVGFRFDNFGEVTAALPGPGRYALALPGGVRVTVHGYETAWSGLPLAPATPRAGYAPPPVDAPYPDAAIAVAGVVLIHQDATLRLARHALGADGRVRHDGPEEPILDLGSARPHVAGVRADAGAPEEAAVAAGESLTLLRPTPGGGLAWRAGWRAPAFTALDLDTADFDGDGGQDLVVLWSDGERRVVEGWRATPEDGLRIAFRFDTDDPVTQIGARRHPEGLDVEAWTADADWLAWTLDPTAETAAPTPVDRPTRLALDGDAETLGTADFDGDGHEVLILATPRTPGVPRELHFVDPSRVPATDTTLTAQAAHATFADADADGTPELWLMEPGGTLKMIGQGADGLTLWTWRDLPDDGPLAALDLDGDGAAELITTGRTRWTTTRGAAGGAGAPWAPARAATRDVLEGVRWASPGVADDERRPGVTWVGVQERDRAWFVKRWTLPPGGDAPVQERDRLELPPELAAAIGDGFSADACDEALWLTSTAGTARIVFEPTIRLDWLEADWTGREVACAGDRAVILTGEGEETAILRVDDRATELERVAAPGVVSIDLAAVPGGFETAEATCTRPGCRALAWWVDGALRTVDLSGEDGSITGAGEELYLPFGGLGALGDLDGDGRADLVAARSDGGLVALRRTPEGPGLPVAWTLPRAIAAGPFLGDVDGDGAAELFAIATDGRLFHTLP